MEKFALLDKFAGILKGASFEDKVGTGLFLQNLGELLRSKDLMKTAADANDTASAQIVESQIRSNPVAPIVQAFMQKQPPQNLMNLIQLFSEKLEQDLRNSISSGPAVTDPLLSENKNLKMMVENLMLKRQLKQELSQDAMQTAQQQAQMAQQQGMAPNPAIAASPMGLGAAPTEEQGQGAPDEATAQAMMQAQQGGEQGGQPDLSGLMSQFGG